MIAAVLAAGALMTGSATAYSACDGSVTYGSRSNPLSEGMVASNDLPFGTWIEWKRPSRVLGRRFARVADTGGPGFLVDIYTTDCAWMNAWGRRTVTIRPVPRSELYRGKPVKGWKFRQHKGRMRLVWSPR